MGRHTPSPLRFTPQKDAPPPNFPASLGLHLKGLIDHEDGDDFTQTLELQLGTMITPTVGIYGELLLGDAVFDTNAYDIGGGVALRIVY